MDASGKMMHTTSQYESQQSPEYSQLAPKAQKTYPGK
jgi:hypothetical protein